MRSEPGARLSCFQNSPRVQDSDDTGVDSRNSYILFKSKRANTTLPLVRPTSFLEFPTIVIGSFSNTFVCTFKTCLMYF